MASQRIEITRDGITLSVRQWAKKTGVFPATIYNKLKRGVPPEEAVVNNTVRYSKDDICSVEDCTKSVRCKGMCWNHYMRSIKNRLDPDKMRARARRCYLRCDPRKHMVTSAKARARDYGVPFDLKYTDFEIPDFCPYLGIPIYRAVGTTYKEHSPTLDRIIPEMGYVPGNVLVVSNRANRAKSNLSVAELRTLAENVERIAKQKGLSSR